MKSVTILAVCLLVAGCGGRVARPVAINNDFDSQLTCGHLRAERGINDSLLMDLTQERKHDDANNVGMVPASPLFLDLSSSERKEADALTKRNAVLDQLIVKKCPA
jgi:hypothetical protein